MYQILFQSFFMQSGVPAMPAYWFRKSVRCLSGVSDGTFKKLMFSSFFSRGQFLVGRKVKFHPCTNKGLVQNASIISLDLNVIGRNCLFDETCIVSVKRKTFLSANVSAMSLWFRSLPLSGCMVCCSPFIPVVTDHVVFIRFFHCWQGLSCRVSFVLPQTDPSGILNQSFFLPVMILSLAVGFDDNCCCDDHTSSRLGPTHTG